MSQGIIYYNKGYKCIVRLILCIQSLRKHYSGNITLFQDGEHDPELIKDLQKNFGVDVIYDMNPSSTTLVRKIEVSEKSPYDYSALIDADMIVVGKVDELLESAKIYDFVATHFAGWKSNGGTIRGRILRFKEDYPQYMDAAVGYGPAINTGVYAWPKGSPFFKEWLPVAKSGERRNTWIPDEIACQILLPQFKCLVLPPKFNVSVKYDPNTEDKRIIHFHGKKHVINAPLCKIWIDAFHQGCIDNICNIRKFADPEFGDRRLRKFFTFRYGWEKEAKQIKAVLNNKEKKQEVLKEKKPEMIKQDYKLVDNPQDVTIVTACDKKYIGHLKKTLPNWIKYKNINQFPMIVYVNGFDNGIDDVELSFLRDLPKVRIIEWKMDNATSQRERMLSSFVFGTARDVLTPYWIKIDADAFCTDNKPLLNEDMKDCMLYGHKWGYTKPAEWIKTLDLWANKLPVFNNKNPLYDPKSVNGRKYEHQRIASYVQFHNTEFVKEAAKIAGDRLPIPSHDTYLWYVAERLGRKWKRHNFKRFTGFSNTPRIEKLTRILNEIEEKNKLITEK